jgi:hypothetical protein
MSYFQGEDETARHLKDLITQGLPLIQDLYGFAYPGPTTVKIAQGGQQAARGYEGITSCGNNVNCSVVVSPAADDITVLHELSHLWSGIYGKRWLSEGFAQLIAEEAAAGLPAGLIQSQPPVKDPPATDLKLDEWGQVGSLIGANESALATENAGYDRSLRFLHLLESEVGRGTLQHVNAALEAAGTPADSQRYLDAIEKISGKPVDQLFAEWVFPSSFQQVLSKRRLAQQRLEELVVHAADKGLTSHVPDYIRADVNGWRFDDAIAAANKADADVAGYEELIQALSDLTRDSDARGLSLPTTISDAIQNWDFDNARSMMTQAGRAVAAYGSSREQVDARPGLWRRLGLLGVDPHTDLTHAAEAFARGDFRATLSHADYAAEKAGSASGMAYRKLLVLALMFGTLAGGIGLAVHVSRNRDKPISMR